MSNEPALDANYWRRRAEAAWEREDFMGNSMIGLAVRTREAEAVVARVHAVMNDPRAAGERDGEEFVYLSDLREALEGDTSATEASRSDAQPTDGSLEVRR